MEKARKAMDNREIRGFITNFETRAEGEDGGVIKGRPIVFDSETDMGWYREVIDRHALDNADLRDVRLCLNHDTSYVYARSRNNNDNSTMRIGVDEEGLYFEARLDLKSAKANDLYVAVQRGDMNQMSFMFVVSSDEWEDIDSDSPLRIIREIRTVYEISVVTFPAYDATSVQAAGKDSGALDNVRASLENVKAEARAIERRKQVIRILSMQ
jgi:HK97 family phage prohead protease